MNRTRAGLREAVVTALHLLPSWNQSLSSRSILRSTSVVVFCFMFGACLLPPGLNSPPEHTDPTDYDNIGYQLSKGHGFSVDWADPGFRAPYLAYGGYEELESLHDYGPSTYRPPLLPAFTYVTFGRKFWPIRTLNALFVALSVSAAFSLVAVRFGLIPGLIAAAWLITDRGLKHYGHMVMTEAPTVFCVILMFCLMLRTVERRSRSAAFGFGLACGLGFLARSVVVVWMPVIAATLALLLFRGGGGRGRREATVLLLLFGLAFSLLAAPWMVRNCIVLDSFQPMGTMGSINMYAAYSDIAVQRHGVWVNLQSLKFFDGLGPWHDSWLEREKALAQYSSAQARQWIVTHYEKIPGLMYDKAASLWHPGQAVSATSLVFVLIGLLRWWRHKQSEAIIVLSLLAACTLAVALTWDVGYGRFLMPVHPLLGALLGLGLWTLFGELPGPCVMRTSQSPFARGSGD